MSGKKEEKKLINVENFNKKYNTLTEEERKIFNKFVKVFEDKSYATKQQIVKNITDAMQCYLNEIYNPKLYNGWAQNFVNDLTEYEAKNSPKHFLCYSNRMQHLYKTTKNIITANTNLKNAKNYNIIQQIKQNNPNNKDLQDLLLPERKICKNYHEALQYIKQKQYKCVIKPMIGANAENVFILNKKDKDGNVYVYDVANRKNYTCGFKLVKDAYYNQQDIVIEDNILTKPMSVNDVTSIAPIVPYKFYCANGQVVCCRIGFSYYKLASFAKRPAEFDEIFLDENKKDFEFANQNSKIKPSEQQDFNKLICDTPTYKKMWRIAEQLSKNYPSIRVDLMCIKQPNGQYKIYFNELQPNSIGTYNIITNQCEEKSIEEYNKMMHFRDVPDDKLNVAGKIIKELDQKAYKKERNKIREVINTNQFSLLSNKQKVSSNIKS